MFESLPFRLPFRQSDTPDIGALESGDWVRRRVVSSQSPAVGRHF